MTTGTELLQTLEAQLNEIGLSTMALKLDEIYNSPDYLTMDKLDLISSILLPEYQDKISKRINNRLRNAHLIGTPCDIESCVDSAERHYEPQDSPTILSSLKFIENGLNVCILGPSDSGKTYLAKALGVAACEKYRVSYNRFDEMLEGLVYEKAEDYKKYSRHVSRIMNIHLLIIDDFLLNTVADEREIKILLEILEKRIELNRSTVVCSQREPDSWKAMIMNDEVSANAILKRVTKHYLVVIQPK